MREARLAADWTSDCAFESRDANWGTPWRENLKTIILNLLKIKNWKNI